MKNLHAALETITVGNGYANTLNRVERVLQRGQSFAPPMAIVLEGEDTVRTGPLSGPDALLSRELQVGVVLVVQQDDAIDARSASEVMNSLVADVQRKLQEDFRRGDLALNTVEQAVSAIEQQEGQPQLACTIEYSIPYRHSRLDPTLAG